MISRLRAEAELWEVRADRIGLIAFSAGGQVAARLICDGKQRSYEAIDDVDSVDFQPNFAVLVYPWNLYDPKTDRLVDDLKIPPSAPPTCLVHTNDDQSSSLGTVMLYTQFKKLGVPAALHVFGDGGHGYGLRSVPGSDISSWPVLAGHFVQKYLQTAP